MTVNPEIERLQSPVDAGKAGQRALIQLASGHSPSGCRAGISTISPSMRPRLRKALASGS